MYCFDYRSCIEPLLPYVPGRPIDDVKREYELDCVVKIASNENPNGCSKLAKEAVIKSLESAMIYPDGNCTFLRNSLASHFNVSTKSLVFGAGADEIISMLGKIFINEGDECITASVTFSQYASSVISMGGNMVYADMKDDAYDLNGILGKITNKTKLIFIANPNNPTGTIFTENEQRDFISKVHANVIVVFDEAYSEFVTRSDFPKTLDYLSEYKNAVLMKTFSKIYGLASLRVGYAIAHPDVISLFEKIRCPFNVASQAQAAAVAALADVDFTKKSYLENIESRDFVCAELDKLGVSYIPTQANFVMLKIPETAVTTSSKEMFVELMKRGYIVRAGKPLGMEGYLRITFGKINDMRGFIDVFKELIK